MRNLRRKTCHRRDIVTQANKQAENHTGSAYCHAAPTGRKILTKRDFWQIATGVLRHTLQGVLHIERRGHLKRGIVTLAERLKLHTRLDGLEAPGHEVNQYIDQLHSQRLNATQH